MDMEDAVVAVKDETGKVKLNQIHNLTATGAVSGGFWGTLIGIIFLNPCLLYTSPSPRDGLLSRMPSPA